MVGAIAAVIVLVPAVIYVAVTSGVGSERLQREAETVLTALLGTEIDTSFGAPGVSLDGANLLAFEIADVLLAGADSGATLVDAGTVRFGLRVVPLLSGEFELGSASIADAKISLAALPARTGDRQWSRGLIGSDGLIEPRLVGEAVFGALHRAFAALERGSTRRLEFTDVEVQLPAGYFVDAIRIDSAEIRRTRQGAITFQAALSLDGRPIALEGEGEKDSESGLISSFELTLNVPKTEFAGPFSEGAAERDLAFTSVGGALALGLKGAETSLGEGRIAGNLQLADAAVAFVNGDRIEGGGALRMHLDAANRKVEIERAALTAGRSVYEFHGAIGPAPTEDEQLPSYRYELVSDGSTIAPGGSTEPDLRILARVAGHYTPETRVFTADSIGVRTPAGEVFGRAVVTFVPGKTPGVDFVLSVPRMPSGHAKQLWPWFAASGAQRWANENLFGGTLRDSRLSMSVLPGRMGDGMPLQSHEISGHFEVDGARFDVAGQIPPVRDAVGAIDFRGTDVDIALDSGTVYLPTGRTVAASQGTLAIRRGELPPVIGDLDIQVKGAADAVAELASYKPIDAMRHLDLSPGDLSGEVEGNVKARIPLQKDVDVGDLGWKVALSYRNLAIAKPFEGQTITEAQGTIEVEPHVAVFKADAKLNGMPAEVAITEPLGASEADRIRNVTLRLDDRTREKLAPGLSDILTGPVSVKLEAGEGSRRRVTTDLADARLAFPWVGWAKSPGVPALVVFNLETVGGETRISDLHLEGKSFSLKGDAVVAGGSLRSARFNDVKLNRSDSVAVDLKRNGSGYAIEVRGKSLDARGLVKQVLDDPVKASGGSGAASTPIAIDARIDSVTGFDGETLSGLKLAYKGRGARVDALEAEAATQGGGKVVITNAVAGEGRKVHMQSSNAGAVLRFLDVYPHMAGGRITLDLASSGKGPLRGQIEARDFELVNEPRLRSIVSTPATGDNRSLNQAIRRDIDTSRVTFERGYARLEKGAGYLNVSDGVLRGPVIGTTFQGVLYDTQGNMAITGTFMPAYGINRLFGEIPLLGQLLGNGRDRGLIGITYKVAGNAKSPQVQVNPISAIAPGIFRSIFEFN